ncbi:MAG: GMP synthase [Porticoccaceae bacterium]|nr:GMP synthase [Porticoccaceae bacterium]
MKLGLLQCDHVRDELIGKHGDYPAMFQTLLNPLLPGWEWQIYPVVDGELPQSPQECDAYLTTGSQHGVNDDLPWIGQLLEFVRELDRQRIKYVGICFGHQVLAKALGGRVEKSAKGWGVGLSFNRLAKQQPWMLPQRETLNLIVSHQDQVTALPANAEVLASSDFCPNYMMQLGGHLLSVQGHPEFSKSYISDLMECRRDRIPAQRIDEALDSLRQDVDDQLMARWITDFLVAETG